MKAGVLLGKRDDEALLREIVTPEGVPLRFTLARAGDRGAAFILDLIILFAGVLGLEWLLAMAVPGEGGSWLMPFAIVALFLAMNFYWAFFEIRWQGATPGKRIVGIRVIDARGGQLEASAILARNLVRELEVWTPIRFLVAGSLLWPEAPGWAKLAAAAWVFVFLLMPLFNRDRLRAGDLLGGTRVVAQPKAMLLPDLADRGGRRQAAAFRFTEAHLDVYGIYELQVLENVLRADAATIEYLQNLSTVATKIHAKIKYPVAVAESEQERFLRDFYAALRAHLEKKMLFGQRRENKHAR